MPEHDPDFEIWPPAGTTAAGDAAMPDWGVAIWRGVLGKCPRCGLSPIFKGYLKVRGECARCGAKLGDVPADDAPPYIAMVVVLQVLGVFVVCFIKGIYRPGILMSGVWLVALTVFCMVALRLAKGAVIGILLKLGMKREVLNG
jgi:uncharacterized protein (DUF983 family)